MDHTNLWKILKGTEYQTTLPASWETCMQVKKQQLEPDILECEVKWALGSITTRKASGGDGISADLFKILKDDTVKVLHQC